MRRLVFPLVFVFLCAVSARPAAPPVINYQKWTADDVVGQDTVSGFDFSPDGRFVLFEKTSLDKEKNAFVTHLFRHDVKSKRQVQLTRGADSCTQAAYSPDGNHIAFLSSRAIPKEKEEKEEKRRRLSRAGSKADEEAKTQVWLLDATGGEPWPLTDSSRNVTLLAWSGEDTILFAAQEDATRRETALKDDRKDTTQVVEDEANEPPVRLFAVDVKTKKSRRLTDNRDRIESLQVSPDGKHAVTSHSRSLRYIYDNKIKPTHYLHTVEGSSPSKPRQVLPDAALNISHIIWATDSTGFYATNERSSKPQLSQAGVTDLLYYDLETKKHAGVPLDWTRGIAAQEDNAEAVGVVAVPGGFLALLADGVRHRLARYEHSGGKAKRAWVSGDYSRNVFGFAVSEDGKRIAFAHSTASSPTRWFHASLNGNKWTDPVEMAPTSAHLATRRMARSEVVRWKGARNEEVEGLLYYPHDWKAGKPAPLVVQIHGGPASADHDNWEENWAYSANLVCQRGAFVLRPNYHGSTNYGLDWVESISDGRYCDLEVEDIEKGVDSLIAKGLVDGKRLALTGWSNGGILTNVLITKTTRYRAAVSGAGSIEYISDWSSCEFGEAFDRYYLGKSPLEDLDLYVRKSPFHRLDRVRTPTLIFFGAEDRVVHPQQGWALYRGLQQLGKAAVRFVQFPGEKHSLKKPSHCRRKLEEEMAWLDRHLFDQAPKEKPELIKPDSPLGWLVARQKAKRVGKAYGEMVGKILVPETVEHDHLQIGRFEVTRAQYASFDANRRVEPGQENYPITNVTFAEAKAYCAWLSKQTGRKYRLPDESEAEELYEAPEDGDITLDNWAGYAVNPEDGLRLRAEIEKLGNSLVREVGSGRGKGKNGVFDLGGNVAEWVTGKKNRGVSRGGSADSPADAKGKTGQAQRNYQGFRVILD